MYNKKLTTSYQICTYSTYIKYTQKKNTVSNDFFFSIEQAIEKLYTFLFVNDNFIENYEVVIFHGNICVDILRVKYDSGLILYNEQIKLVASILFPSFAVFDIMHSNRKALSHISHDVNQSVEPDFFAKKTPEKNVEKISPKSHRKINKQNRHANLLKKAAIAEKCSLNSNRKNEERQKKNNKDFDEEFEKKKELVRNEKIIKNRNSERFRIFVSDKKVYQSIKKDIQEGKISLDEINPFFVEKFQIFKILESRNVINFDSDNNINSEYEIFIDLYNACNDDINTDKKIDAQQIYIPHNYHFMTLEKKKEYARKYNMTVKQFEDRYINGTIDDDIIENCISQKVLPNKENNIDVSDNTNNKICDMTTNSTIDLEKNMVDKKNVRTSEIMAINNSDNSNDCYSYDNSNSYDSESSENDIPKVDLSFLNLVKQDW